uniref:Fucosyltransferase n=1 Tax=Sinocyclocheilus rhinocerous TaxID=307959 RepID=A0A673NFA1_9TELE
MIRIISTLVAPPTDSPSAVKEELKICCQPVCFSCRTRGKVNHSEHNCHGFDIMFYNLRGLRRKLVGIYPICHNSQRPAFQKLVWWNMEFPSNSYPLPMLKDLFNITSSYRWDIPVPYGRITDTTEEEKNYTIPKEDKLRLQYYTELVKYINVSAFGRHFKNPLNATKYSNLVSICKLYLSFENSIHRYYVTEKLFNVLALGAVPVVLGPHRENYEQFLPSKAFIHVDDFPSPKELADHLKLLDQNEDLYKQYFPSTKTLFGLEHACWICDHIRRNKHYKDLNSWLRAL